MSHFSIILYNPDNNRQCVVRHIPAAVELFAGPKAWFSNIAVIRQEFKFLSIPTNYLPITTSRLTRVKQLEVICQFRGDRDVVDVAMFTLYNSSRKRLDLIRRPNVRVKFSVGSDLIGTDSSGPDDRWNALVRAVLTKTIKADIQ